MLRKLFIRILLLGAVVAFSVFLFSSGKGHTLLLDNKTATMGGHEHAAVSAVTVTVDSLKPVKILPGERDLVVVKGVHHRITVSGAGVTVEKRFELPFEDMFLCSMPALLDGDDAWFEAKRPEAPKAADDSNKEEVPVAGEILPL
jgi:hypothetical protein